MKKWKWIYILFFFAACVIPSAGMLAGTKEVSLENRTLSSFPVLFPEEGGINTSWLPEAGDWFQDHFAFRDELVTANAWLNGRLLGTSVVPSVIQGRHGWLYYTDSLNDYQGKDLLSDRSIFNIAHTLEMTARMLEGKNVKLVFAAAPNKNSLYRDNMPYYDRMTVSEEKNILRLQEALAERNIRYADLYSALGEQPEVLYHERDSHWNNMGAAIASSQLLQAAGHDAEEPFEEREYEIRKDFFGDLDQMLYPAAMIPEDEYYFEGTDSFRYTEEVESNFSPRITTVSEGKNGNLVMYRDSFANALIPFLASSYGNAYFSRGVPYQLSDVDRTGADTVIMERAERFLPEAAQNPPVIQNPGIRLPAEPEKTDPADLLDCEVTRQGLYYRICGRLPELPETESRIFVRADRQVCMEAFPMDLKTEDGVFDSGYCLHIPQDRAGESVHLEVMTEIGGVLTTVSEGDLPMPEAPAG